MSYFNERECIVGRSSVPFIRLHFVRNASCANLQSYCVLSPIQLRSGLRLGSNEEAIPHSTASLRCSVTDILLLYLAIKEEAPL